MQHHLGRAILKRLCSEARDEYLRQAVLFFSPLSISREDLIEMLNNLKSKLASDFLFNIRMFQYCNAHIDSEDDILRPILLVSMLEVVERQIDGAQSASAIENALLRLDARDKNTLISRYEYLRTHKGKKGYYKLYLLDILNSNDPKGSDMDVEELSLSPEKRDWYLKKVARIFWEARCSILHDFKHSPFTSYKDEHNNPVFLFTYLTINKNKKSKRQKKLHLRTTLTKPEFEILIKKAVLLSMKQHTAHTGRRLVETAKRNRNGTTSQIAQKGHLSRR